jgi:RNA polymerase sigma-70 factor (ECF subfamily)
MAATAESLARSTKTLCSNGELTYAPAMEHTPDEQRDTFLLHEEAGLNLDQIAFVTGSNRETAKSRLRYAVNKLRAAIDEHPEQQ